MAASKTAGLNQDGANAGGRDRGELWVVGALALVLVLWFATPFVVPALIDRFGKPDTVGQYNNSGPFSDMFGAVTSLFTGIAFVGVAYTIILQRRELRGQAEELALQRAEDKRQLKRHDEELQDLTQQREDAATTQRIATATTLFGYSMTLHTQLIEQIDRNEEIVQSGKGNVGEAERLLERDRAALARNRERGRVLFADLDRMYDEAAGRSPSPSAAPPQAGGSGRPA